MGSHLSMLYTVLASIKKKYRFIKIVIKPTKYKHRAVNI